jgi:hypothetical protein
MDYIENRAASPDPPPPPTTGNLTVRCWQNLTVRRSPRPTPRKSVSIKRISVTQDVATHRLPQPSVALLNIMSVVRRISASACKVASCSNGAAPKAGEVRWSAVVGGGRRWSAVVGGGRKLRKCLRWRWRRCRCRTVKQADADETDPPAPPCPETVPHGTIPPPAFNINNLCKLHNHLASQRLTKATYARRCGAIR